MRHVRTCLIILVAVCATVALTHAITVRRCKEHSTVRILKVGEGETVYTLMAPIKILEVTTDENSNGIFESISAWFGDRTPHELSYSINDKDEDGNTDSVWAIGRLPASKHGKWRIMFSDDDSGHGLVRMFFHYQTEDDLSSGVIYRDFNGDGRFDTMRDKSANREWVLVENAWCETKDMRFFDLPAPQATVSLSGSDVRMIFKEGEWFPENGQ